jgi:hypothetical protein
MQIIDVLYTPLDTVPQPEIDIDKFTNWLKDSYVKLAPYRKLVTDSRLTAINFVDNYPWNLVLVYYNIVDRGPGWLGDFDKEFPELANWMVTAFGVNLDDIGTLAFLPVRPGHTGMGFWHNDPDPHGLRFYVHFEHPDQNKLYIKRTKIPYDTRQQFPLPIDQEQLLQEELVECKLLRSNQSFFLNNIRSCHATYTEVPNSIRVACLMSSKYSNHDVYKRKIEKLVVDSAEKYKDYAVLWQPESGTS